MLKKFAYVSAAIGALFLLLRPAGANKNFVPDWTFQGSSLGAARRLGSADWHAENGEIVGTPNAPGGGWLILDKPLQDVQFASTFRCTGGCRAGVMLRVQTTPEGMQGVYVALPEGDNPAAAFALKLDPQGREIQRQPLNRGFGTVRFIAPPSESARGGQAPPAGRGGGRGGAGRGFGGQGAALPPNSPYTRPTYAYQPNEWNPLEIILDANYLRVWINDGPEGGSTNGQADEEFAKYGPVALYVGGTGEVRFKQVEFKDLGRHFQPAEKVSSRFRMQRISDYYYAWSAAAADINHDGILDIIAGPFYYLGPDYQVSREIYPSQTSAVGTQYTPAAVNFAYDYTGDGWPDVLVSAGRAMVLYVNPKGELRRWDKYNVLPTISSEVAVFKDIDGDGKPDAVFLGGGTVCWAGVDPVNPTAPWIVHTISEPGYGVVAQHGIGAGDINGDGRMDIVSPYGWWEQPPKGTTAGPWPYHPVMFGRWPRAGASPGGAELGVYDVNGDGLNDVVTSLEAHGWGLAWYEQKRDKSGGISFTEHLIADDYSARNPGNVAFSEAHASTFADVDGDGIPDFIVGKRLHAHLESYTDPDSFGPPVLYWFRTVRNPKAPGGAEFQPELIHNRSGVGSTVLAVDLNKDGAMDIVTSTDRGTYIFWGKRTGK
uniref:FG-GAP repeat protein n=1 Tax=Solibacter usitatus (strain Ellin6076) TaxID=234267 RepID=Q026X4_SOLUE